MKEEDEGGAGRWGLDQDHMKSIFTGHMDHTSYTCEPEHLLYRTT